MPFFANPPERGLISPILMVEAELVLHGSARNQMHKMMETYLINDKKKL
jgi:hypothetical protein